jgi:hypothetical protein
VVDSYLAHTANGEQSHGIRGCVRVGRGESEPRGGGIRDEKRGDSKAEFVDEVRREEVAQDSGAAFDQKGHHTPFLVKIGEDSGKGEFRLYFDDFGRVP